MALTADRWTHGKSGHAAAGLLCSTHRDGRCECDGRHMAQHSDRPADDGGGESRRACRPDRVETPRLWLNSDLPNPERSGRSWPDRSLPRLSRRQVHLVHRLVKGPSVSGATGLPRFRRARAGGRVTRGCRVKPSPRAIRGSQASTTTALAVRQPGVRMPSAGSWASGLKRFMKRRRPADRRRGDHRRRRPAAEPGDALHGYGSRRAWPDCAAPR